MAYLVEFYTGEKPKAGTDANVRLILHDVDGMKTSFFELASRFKNDFERGQIDSFNITLQETLKLGDLGKVEFWRDDAGMSPNWYVDKVRVEDKSNNVDYYFPVFRWIKPHHHYVIPHLDTTLPQFDDNIEERRMELEDKRKLYQLEVKVAGLPAQVKKIPADEQFSVDYRWDIKKTKYNLGMDKLIIKLKSQKWTDLASLKNIYVTEHLKEPQGAKGWTDDSHFGNQRVADINSVMIKLCTAIPDKFGVTDEMVKPHLEGMTLQQAIDNKRLFIVDLEVMKGVPGKSEKFTFGIRANTVMLNMNKVFALWTLTFLMDDG